MNKDSIRKDILAFADDDSEVIIESNGDVLFYKNGTELLCSIKTNCDGITKVIYNGEELSYNDFIAKKIARLDIFVQKIKEKRKKLEEFIDGPAHLYTTYRSEEGKALELLKKECDNFLQFGSRINFITADAGHGKSILLKQFQYLQAERYSNKESNYLFWHIDLQGRDLVRLGEAIMYDLGELRMPGLYYPSIINLIQKKMIILAIDGFDELAAEIGGTNAVSSLSNFINEMDGQGTLVCASRRTFFDTGDYLKRTNIISREKPLDIVFNELKLKDWTKEQVINYFDFFAYDEPEKTYRDILLELQNDEQHPILTRPFLLAKLEQALDGDTSLIPVFFSNKEKNGDGVALIVESFMRREVEKWKDRNATDKETGKPYLTIEQHIQLLSFIAKEMWESKKDFVTKEEIEFYTVLLIDEWKISEDIKKIIVRIATSHAFLVPIHDDRMDSRKFDHDEFEYYFLARALSDLINKCVEQKKFSLLRKFLYIDQLPDSVATYCFNYVQKRQDIAEVLLDAFAEIVNDEWKPTYLQTNIGTLIPFLLHNINNELLKIKAKINYSSLIFESKTIKNVIFEDGIFINISLRNTFFENIEFINCEFNEIKFEKNGHNTLRNVRLKNSIVNSIIIVDEGEVIEMAYAPKRIEALLNSIGISMNDNDPSLNENGATSLFKKTLLKFIIKYNQLMIQYEISIRDEKYLGSDFDLIFDEVIPVLEKHKIIEKVDTKASRQTRSNAWRLLVNIEELLKDDKEVSSQKYAPFWDEVNKHK